MQDLVRRLSILDRLQIGEHDLLHPAYPGKMNECICLETFSLPIELQGLQCNIETDLVPILEAVSQGLLRIVQSGNEYKNGQPQDFRISMLAINLDNMFEFFNF